MPPVLGKESEPIGIYKSIFGHLLSEVFFMPNSVHSSSNREGIRYGE